MTSSIKQFHAVIQGRVQGVGYRFFARNQANKLGICGWVKNLPDDDVEVLAQGTEDVLKQFLIQLGKGPEMSFVQNVDVDWETPERIYTAFDIHF